MENKEINLIDYLYILIKRRRLIIINFTLVCVIAIIISLLLPKWYTSTAVIMPPKSEFPGLNISSLISKLPLSGLGISGNTNEVLSFMAILKSRAIREKIVEKFNLITVYEKKDIEKTLRALENHIEFIIADEGQIFVSVEDKIPERAAEMTNTFVALLDSIYTNLNIEKARNDRIFIGQRFEQNKSDLRNSEEALKDFQEKHGIINIPEQTKAAITSAAELQSLVYTTEIELGIKQKYLTSNHIEILQTKTKLKEFKRKLRELKVGTSTNDGGFIEQNDLYIPFEHVPEIGLNYVRLLREVEVQNKIFELLIQLYEQAKIEEAKDIPNIQILDYGAIPIYKSRPKRSIIVIVAGLFSLIITCTFIFMQQFLKNAASRQDDQAEKLKWIQSELRDDLRFIRKKRS